MAKVKLNRQKATITLKQYTDFYKNLLIQYAMTMFEWKNLPDTVDAWFIEKKLLSVGQVVFWKDENFGYRCLPFNEYEMFNRYEYPSKVMAYDITGYTKDLNYDDCVLIYANSSKTTLEHTLKLYAVRLANLQMTIDANCNIQKFPYIVKCSDNTRLQMENLYSQIEGYEPAIFADKTIDMSGISVLPTNAPFVADKLEMLKSKYLSEILTLLGINNPYQPKKERLVSAEAESIQGQIDASRNIMLMTRQMAVEKINKKYGLNVEVTYRTRNGVGDDVAKLGIHNNDKKLSGNDVSNNT